MRPRRTALCLGRRHLQNGSVLHRTVNPASATARIRTTWDVLDSRWLKEDGANLAPVLLRLRESESRCYQRSVETIRLILPFFADFEFETEFGRLLLGWREIGSDRVFNASQAADGMLRAMALVTLLLQPEQDLPGVLILDEPELGLHPYVNSVLAKHLADLGVWGDARCVMTNRRCGKTYRGGLVSYAHARKDIERWMKKDHKPDAAFTTMFDLCALPDDFPGYAEARNIRDPRQRVAALEQALRQDIPHPRFVPHLQLHEFEALLLADPQKLDSQYPNDGQAIRNLVKMASSFSSPELIDDGQETAPSKRIIREIPRYEGMKVSVGPLVAQRIGLGTLRARCAHLDQWISALEALAQGVGD